MICDIFYIGIGVGKRMVETVGSDFRTDNVLCDIYPLYALPRIFLQGFIM